MPIATSPRSRRFARSLVDGPIQMRLARAGAAHQHDVALMGQELAAAEVAHQTLVDRRPAKGELGEVLGQRQLGRDPMRSGSHGTLDRHLVADRARLLLADLGLQQVADDLLRFVAALEGDLDDLVVGRLHPEQLQLAHGGEDLLTFHHPDAWGEQALAHQPDLVLDLPLRLA